MTTYCLTFGDKFRREPHPTFPDAHPDGWVEIEAADEQEAVKIGYALFGNDWSRAYTCPEMYCMRMGEMFPRGRLAVMEDPR